jgi:hypothetical protein
MLSLCLDLEIIEFLVEEKYMKKRLKKMNIREFRLFVSAATLLSTASDNRENGSVNWDFVSADLHTIYNIGEFRDEDIEAILCAADLGVKPEDIIETHEIKHHRVTGECYEG